MSVRAPALAALALIAAVSAGCATAPAGAPPTVNPGAFRAEDFAWSERSGPSSISGVVAYRQNGRAFACSGSVGLTPDTRYTRERFSTLYGSIDRAAVEASVVRSRNVPDPTGDYSRFTRTTTCQNNRFSFSGLPDGSWFVIAPVRAEGAPAMVLMRRVETRGGRAVSIEL